MAVRPVIIPGTKVLLVGSVPSQDDIDTGTPFSGADGRVLHDTLLRPAGLSRGDVSLAVIDEEANGAQSNPELIDTINDARPVAVVALGKDAARALGDIADIKCPHPAAVRRLGDTGQMARKARKIKAALEPAFVPVTKSASALQIVYGAVLDPYGNTGQPEADLHNDWVTPAAVQASAHGYLCRSRVVGLEHLGVAHSAEVVESHVEHYPSQEDYAAAMVGEDHSIWRRPVGSDWAHSGSWWIGVRLPDELWEAYLAGEINAFSPGGMLSRESIAQEDLPKVNVIELVPRG